jgi:hypothetical protein
MRVKLIKFVEGCKPKNLTIGKVYEAIICDDKGDYKVLNDIGQQAWLYKSEVELIEYEQTDQHYNNTNGSLYLFAQQHELNAWEFDILKRIVRCRKKGQFKEDLEKTKRVIDLYLKEFEA